MIFPGNYAIAVKYLCLNLSLVLLALFFGLGFIFSLQRLLSLRNNRLAGGDVAFLALGAGFAVIIAELFFLALAGLLSPAPILVAFIGTGVLCGITLFYEGKRWLTMPAVSITSLTALVFLFFLLALQFSSLSQPNLGDGTSFHLPYADVFLKNKGLAVDYHLIYPFMSLNASLFYSLALLLEHDIVYAQSVNALFATLTLFGIYRACLYTKQKHYLAVVMPFIFLALYTVNYGRYAAYADLASMFFIFSAIFPLLLWYNNRNSSWLLLCSATCLGIAMGSKYIMSVFSIPIAIYIIMLERRNFLRPLFLYGVWAALWGLWWYIRNFIYTGNPVHPFAAEIFGYSLWDAGDMKRQFMALNVGYLPQNIFGFILAPVFAFRNSILVEQDVFYVLLMLYVTAPLIYFAEKSARYLLLFCFVFILFWVFTTSDPRYLLPAIPLIFVYTGSVVQGVLLRLGKQKTISRIINILPERSLSLLLIVCAFIPALLDIQEKINRVPYLAINAEASRQRLLEENPTYDLIDHTNREFGPQGRVFEFYYRDGRWFSSNILLGTQFGEHAYWRILTAATVDKNGTIHYSPEKLKQILMERYQVDGFIIPNPGYFKNHYDQKEFEAVFDLRYQNGDGSIYRIKK